MFTQLFATVMNRLQFPDEEGQDLAEYALIAVLISIAAIVAMGALGVKLNTVIASVTTALK